MKKVIINIIIILAVIGVIVGFNSMMNTNEKTKIKHEETEDGHSHGSEGPKILDATLQMGKVCIVDTDKGSFEIVLMQRDIPNTTKMFLKTNSKKAYNDLAFDEVKDWMIKTDLPKIDFEPIETEMAYGLSAYRGAVCMSKGNKSFKTVPSFFVIKECSPSVGEAFATFGYVVKGMDVVDKITENDKIKSIKYRKATSDDEKALIEIIKAGKEDSEKVGMVSGQAEQLLMEKQMKGPAEEPKTVQ